MADDTDYRGCRTKMRQPLKKCHNTWRKKFLTSACVCVIFVKVVKTEPKTAGTFCVRCHPTAPAEGIKHKSYLNYTAFLIGSGKLFL